MKHEKFHYHSLNEVKEELKKLGVELPLSEDLSVLSASLEIQGRSVPNRLAIQPMEGCDGTADGKPDDLTLRRYRRFAESGAGLIWEEATAIVPEGRANPRQLWIHKENLDSYKSFVEGIKSDCMKKNGFEPLVIMQATHSGRYSKPNGIPEPWIAYHNPIFEKDHPISDDRIISDERLRELEEIYGQAAGLAEQAGFDGVDIKCCHRYLLSELMSAYERKGNYGGSFENRSRLFLQAVRNAKENTSSAFIVTSRMNIYDGFPWPNGFGVEQGQGTKPCLEEAVRLVRILHHELGVQLLDFTIGNPYFNPHVNRPYDNGGYVPDEHPLEGVARMFDCIREVSSHFPELKVISSGHSYLRQFSPYLAAGAVSQGISSMAGFGREAFAYPQFAGDLLKTGKIDERKCCITCGKCTELMRAGSVAGCVIRDSGVYGPIYQRDVMKK